MSYRILQLIGGGEIGGAEIHLLNLMLSTAKNQANFSLGCLCQNSPFALQAEKRDIPVTLFPMRFPLDILPLPRMISYCRKQKIDLIHAHGVRADFLGRLAAKFLAIPCISTVHSLWQDDYPSPWKGKIALYTEKLTLPLSAGLITISESLHHSLSALLSKRQSKKIPRTVIFNGYPALDFGNKAELRQRFRERWKIPPEALVIGTIGRLHPAKGQINLFRALEHLQGEFPDLHFLLIGDGLLFNDFKGLLETSTLNYTMPGYLPNAWEALPAMDLFVLPSIREGMGLVLLETIQAGIPIVASRAGGIPELLVDHTDALLVPPGSPQELASACRTLLGNPSLANSLAQNALKKASLFSLDRMAEKTLAFYAEVLKV